jgi:hypothetical protein
MDELHMKMIPIKTWGMLRPCAVYPPLLSLHPSSARPIDTMFMPLASGFCYILHCPSPSVFLSVWPEWCALRLETDCTLGSFIFEEILCRWGAAEEIVTDNGTRAL